jgi:hypothetical protein
MLSTRGLCAVELVIFRLNAEKWQAQQFCLRSYLLLISVLLNLLIVVLWVVVPCSLVGGYQHFRGNCPLHLQSTSSVLKMKVICPSKTLVTTYRTTRRPNPEDQNLHYHSFENLRSLHAVKLDYDTLPFRSSNKIFRNNYVLFCYGVK